MFIYEQSCQGGFILLRNGCFVLNIEKRPLLDNSAVFKTLGFNTHRWLLLQALIMKHLISAEMAVLY